MVKFLKSQASPEKNRCYQNIIQMRTLTQDAKNAERLHKKNQMFGLGDDEEVKHDLETIENMGSK
jgi:hypothetical protein